MDALRDYWPILLSAVAVIVFAARQESIGRALTSGLSDLTEQVKLQNGRIGKLERWQAYENGRHGFPLNGHTENGGGT